jgi:hypothetical protein
MLFFSSFFFIKNSTNIIHVTLALPKIFFIKKKNQTQKITINYQLQCFLNAMCIFVALYNMLQ